MNKVLCLLVTIGCVLCFSGVLEAYLLMTGAIPGDMAFASATLLLGMVTLFVTYLIYSE